MSEELFNFKEEGKEYTYEIIIGYLYELTPNVLKSVVHFNEINFQNIVCELTGVNQTGNHIDIVIANLYHWFILEEMH